MAYVATAFDASYKQGSGVSVVAGLVGEAKQWKCVKKEWLLTLNNDWPELNGVFHLAKLPRLVGHERAAVCEKMFARIIGVSDLVTVAGVVSDADFFKDQSQFGADPIYKQPHFLALECALRALWDEITVPEKRTPCALFLDRDYGPESNADRIFEDWCEKNHVDHNSFSVTHGINGVPKQCADLIAGAIRRASSTRFHLLGDPLWIFENEELLSLASSKRRICQWSDYSHDHSMEMREAIKRGRCDG